MRAKSIKGTSPDEIKVALQKATANGFKPALAIVFLSVKQDLDAINKMFDKAGIVVFGATTNGEFTGEGITEKSVAILLLEINSDYFTIQFSELSERNYRQTTQAIAKKALEKFAHPAFLIAGSNLATDAEELLHGFEDIIGLQVNVCGCMAGDDFSFTEQFVFTNGRSSNSGIVVLVLDEDKVTVKGKATCGWKPIDILKTVTKSEGNRVYTIENLSVLEMTKKYSGLENLTPENPSIAAEIATSFPLQLQREQGESVMRPGLVVNWQDGSFICSGKVPQGSKIKFSLPPDFDVIEKVIQGCKDLKRLKCPRPLRWWYLAVPEDY